MPMNKREKALQGLRAMCEAPVVMQGVIRCYGPLILELLDLEKSVRQHGQNMEWGSRPSAFECHLIWERLAAVGGPSGNQPFEEELEEAVAPLCLHPDKGHNGQANVCLDCGHTWV